MWSSRISRLVFFAALCLFSSWGGAQPRQSLVGKWQEVGGDETMEYFSDGTFRAKKDFISASGRYRYLDEHRLQVQFTGLLGLAGPQVYTVEFSPDGRLHLTDRTGRRYTYVRRARPSVGAKWNTESLYRLVPYHSTLLAEINLEALSRTPDLRSSLELDVLMTLLNEAGLDSRNSPFMVIFALPQRNQTITAGLLGGNYRVNDALGHLSRNGWEPKGRGIYCKEGLEPRSRRFIRSNQSGG